jgi:hypothetical protein
MKAVFAIIGLGLVAVLSGCVSPPTASVAVASVGPNPGAPRNASAQGGLEVFSKLSVRTDDQNQESTDPIWYQHSDYYLCDASGKPLKHVVNAAGHYDGDPRILNLPPGRYIVEAQSAPDYWVRVPVKIMRGATTRVHLDGHWAPPGYVDKTQVVTLPNGKPVGWGM